MSVSSITIRPRRPGIQPESLANHILLQGEEQWYLEGSEELIEQAASALEGLCEPITKHMLLVNFGNAVGWFRVPGIGLLEVISGKWERRHFDQMLVELSIWAAALPFSIEGGSIGSERSAGNELNVFYHAFVYLRSVLSDYVPHERRLLDAVRLVIQEPHRQLEQIRREVPLDTVRRVDSTLLVDLAAGSYPLVRVERELQQRLPLALRLRGHVPEYVRDTQGEITFDTPENRFVKAFLDYALGIIARMRNFIEETTRERRNAFQRRVLEDCDRMDYVLRPSRQHALWKEVGPMVHVPVGSTVLQRRRGYREIFEHYSRMLLATRVPLTKEMEQDLLEVKDIANLYELWCYFACSRQLELLLGPPYVASRVEAQPTELVVRRGIQIQWIDGTRLSYNLQFSHSSSNQQFSYSLPLRPDIVLEVPHGPNAGLHLFDAKFKVRFVELQTPIKDLAEAQLLGEERRGRFKPEDIYKMHTYLDAISHTQSAWILYPGSDLRFYGREGHALSAKGQMPPQVIQGVGAIPMNPGNEEPKELERVLRRILDLPLE